MSVLASADILTGTQNTEEHNLARRKQGVGDAQKGEEIGKIDTVRWSRSEG